MMLTAVMPSCPVLDLTFLERGSQPRHTSKALLLRAMSESPFPTVNHDSSNFEPFASSFGEDLVVNVELCTENDNVTANDVYQPQCTARKWSVAKVIIVSVVVLVLCLAPLIVLQETGFPEFFG